MADAITPKAFAEKFPDAVNDWKNEAFKEGHATGASEAAAQAVERYKAILDLCEGDHTLAGEQFAASADDTAVLKAVSAKLRAERDQARKSGEIGGAEPVNVVPVPEDKSDEDKAEAKLLADAAKITNAYARAAFLANKGREDLLDRVA